jgi:hypothetical protein
MNEQFDAMTTGLDEIIRILKETRKELEESNRRAEEKACEANQ